jgi:DNA-binding protein HU-beta
MTKADLVAHVASQTGIKRSQADAAVASLLDGVSSALSGGDKVTLVGFGTFSVSHREGRKGLNPRTKQPIQIPASNTVRFKAGKALKESVNG